MSFAPTSALQNLVILSKFATSQSNLKTSLTDRIPTEPSLIRDVAKRCLIELAVSLAIGTVAALFTATPLHGTLIFAAIVVQTVCNAALRLTAQLAARLPETEETRCIQSVAPYFCTTMFAYLTAGNAQSLIHESGHALSAKWMFQNANPEIILTPCFGGITRFSTTTLSSWGKTFGRSNAILIVTLMGLGATLLVSAVAIAVGFAIQKKFPELGYYFIKVGKGDFLAHSAYALTALFPEPGNQAHDFIRLRTYGIHPIAAAIAILAIPILITQAFERVERFPCVHGTAQDNPQAAEPLLPSKSAPLCPIAS